MSFVDSEHVLWRELSAIVGDEGLSLYDLERQAESGVKVVVTSKLPSDPTSRGQGGVTSDDCARVCRRLITYLSVEGSTLGFAPEPHIEVCSPGVNRNLRLLDHYTSAVGERVRVTWERSTAETTQSFTTIGVLQEVTDNRLSLIEEKSGDEMNVLLNEVRKARVDFPF
jgi:ribosome maturation factor RimP